MIVRAAWSPSYGGAGVDLEVQASATSVGLLHDVEVIVQSRWQRADMPATVAPTERRVLPRDARSAAFSYDGRESAADLRRLVTLAMTDSPRIHSVSLPGAGDELAYVEMVSADDVARLMRLESIESRLPAPETMAFSYGLFGHDFEKGVVFRARLRGCWIGAETSPDALNGMYRQLLDEPLPLGP